MRVFDENSIWLQILEATDEFYQIGYCKISSKFVIRGVSPPQNAAYFVFGDFDKDIDIRSSFTIATLHGNFKANTTV